LRDEAIEALAEDTAFTKNLGHSFDAGGLCPCGISEVSTDDDGVCTLEFSKALFEMGKEVEKRNRVVIDKLMEVVKALPLENFKDDMGSHDAADFVDNARSFFDAMQKAKKLLEEEGN
jgi:hypothetical protein